MPLEQIARHMACLYEAYYFNEWLWHSDNHEVNLNSLWGGLSDGLFPAPAIFGKI